MFIGASPGSTGGGVKTSTFATLFLTLTEHASFMDILFEDLSAFGTVGLSRGLTPHLTVAARLHKVWQKEERVEKVNYLPHPNDVIGKGDILLVIGEEKDIERLSKGEWFTFFGNRVML